MNRWANLLIAAVAVGAAAAVVFIVARKAAERAALDEVPDIIDDCFERIEQIKQELHRLKPDTMT